MASTNTQRDKRRERIIECARRSFSQSGVINTRMRDIAKQVGLKRSTIFRYFDSKEQLFAAVIRRESEALVDELYRAVDECDGAEAKLWAFIETRVTFMQRLAELNHVMVSEIPLIQPLVTNIFKDYRVQMHELLERVLRSGIASGEFQINDVVALSRGILLFMRGIDSAILYESEMAGLEHAQRKMIDTILSAIRVRAHSK